MLTRTDTCTEITMPIKAMLLDLKLRTQQVDHHRQAFPLSGGNGLHLKIAEKHDPDIVLIVAADMRSFIRQGTAFPYTTGTVYNEMVTDIAVVS